MIKYYWEWFLMCLGLLYWAVTAISVSIIGMLLYWLLPRKYGSLLGRFIIQKAFLVFVFFLKITGLLILKDDDLKILAKQKGAMIVAPNHLALWDVVFIVAQIPKLICIMKGSILNNPFLGGGARLAGYIPMHSMRQMLEASVCRLQQDEQILMFPEGTRTRPNVQWMNPLKGGIALMAKKAAVPVVPVFIRSNTRFYEKGWPIYKRPEFPLKISINVGDPVQINPGETARAFGQRLEKIYLDELAKPHPLRRKINNNI